LRLMVILPHPARMTISFENQYSIQMSYGRFVKNSDEAGRDFT
jgi:hypothetical protein